MKVKSKSLKITIFVILASILLFSFCTVWADINSDVEAWKSKIESAGNKVQRYRFKANGKEEFRYALKIPSPGGNNIVRTPIGTYVHQDISGDHIVTTTNLKLYAKITYNGQVVSSGTKDAAIVFTNSNDDMLVLDGVKFDNKKNKVFWENGPEEGVSESDFINNLKIEITIKTSAGQTLSTCTLGHSNSSPDHHGEDIWTRLKEIIEAFFDFLKDIISTIINFILMAIARGIKALIEAAVGKGVTLYTIIFNKTPRFTIDFWSIPNKVAGDPTLTTEETALLSSVAGIMKPVIDYWYRTFRSIAIICYLILLLYVGIRILIASTAMRLEDLKERLNTWITGLVILLFFPIVMKYLVDINNLVVKAIENKGTAVVGTPLDQKQDVMEKVYDYCDKNNNIPLTICYMIMLGELILLIIAYYKRAFMIGFLITFFPIVCIKHLFDGIHAGRKRSCSGSMDERILCACLHAVNTCSYLFCVDRWCRRGICVW